MDRRYALLLLVVSIATCFIYSVTILSILPFTNVHSEKRVNLTGVNCSLSTHIGRKLFFHVCLKENKKVYDVRYFWENEDQILKANIIGVQMNQAEFEKICKYCPSEVLNGSEKK